MTTRHPQDPQGSAARRFRDWLLRDKRHRKVALENRLARPDDGTDFLGNLAALILVVAILVMGIGRLLTGRFFPW